MNVYFAFMFVCHGAGSSQGSSAPAVTWGPGLSIAGASQRGGASLSTSGQETAGTSSSSRGLAPAQSPLWPLTVRHWELQGRGVFTDEQMPLPHHGREPPSTWPLGGRPGSRYGVECGGCRTQADGELCHRTASPQGAPIPIFARSLNRAREH